MKTIYDSNGNPVTAEDKDAGEMIKHCGFTVQPKIARAAAAHPVPDHKAPPEVKPKHKE